MTDIIEKKVISISRRVEMLGYFPEKILAFLNNRLPPEKVHTLVFWSKKPQALISNLALRKKLERYEQCFLHFTISGMGGTYLEPGILSTKKSLNMLASLIDFIKDPDRICIRFDPIVHLRLPDGTHYTNLELFPKILSAVQKTGIKSIKVSWMENYPKVDKRFRKHQIYYTPPKNKINEQEWILQNAKTYHMEVTGCCVPDWSISSCIDGERLTQLHPQIIKASLEKASGQRLHCGCTKSWDIGWYYPCPGQCLYCYANPVLQTNLRGIHPQHEKESLMKLL